MQTDKRSTPPQEREAVLIYRSVLDTVRDAEDPVQGNSILRDLLECAFGCKRLEDVPNPNRMIIRPMLVSIDKAAARYDTACEYGRRGGRPRLELDREELERDYAALGSWEKVAEKHGIGLSTLYRERRRWENDRSTGQNLTNTNTYTRTNTKTNTFTKTTDHAYWWSAAAAEERAKREPQKDPMEQLERAFRALRESNKGNEERRQEQGKRE